MVPVRGRGAGRAAADRRTGSSTAAALPAPDYAPGAAGRGPATVAEETAVRAVRRGARRGRGSGPTTTSSPWAGTRCWRCGWSAGSGRCWAPSCRCGRCSRRRPRPGWRRGCGEARPGAAAAGGRGRARSGCRCRSRSSGCGSSPSWRARRRPTTSRWRCGWRATWTPAALEAALGDVIARHEVLRTVFPAARRRAVPAGAGDGRAGLAAAGGRGGARRTWPRRWPRRRASRSTWRRSVPVRARLLAGGPGVHVLVLVIHHIATDGWSMGVLARDLSAAYAARRRGPGAGVGAAAGAVRGLRAVAAGAAGRCGRPGQPAGRGRLAGGGRRWRGAGGAGAAGRPAAPGGRPATGATRCRWRSRPRCTRRLAGLAREQGVTLFMVVQAALAVLLSRLGAGEDIPIGTPVGGPDRRGAG